MKKLALLLIPLFATVTLWAQDTTRGGKQVAPRIVEQKFQSEFPKAIAVDWKAKDNRFMAIFKMNGYRMKALYTSAGLWLYTDIDVPLEKVPRNARLHCKNKFPDFTIEGTGFHDSMNKGSFYLVKISKNGQNKYLKYDDKGNFLGAK